MTVSIEHKLGGLLITGFFGYETRAEDYIIRDIEQHGLGGVILFDKHLATRSERNNIINPEQVGALSRDLQIAAGEQLFIATDQEGGLVSRFKQEYGFPETGTAYALGQTSTECTEKAAQQTAKMLKDAGVNFNFAPVVDLNSNPANPIIGKYQRSFSADPAVVIRHAKIWINTHRTQNIISCLKHFPGHGSAQSDSHQGFVDISNSWQKAELTPYLELHKQQLVDAIMTGHLFNHHFDTEYPATLSYSTLEQALRQKVNYNGVVLSDDMQMGAISKFYGFEEACCKALMAGVDILVIGNNLSYDPEIVPKLTTFFKRALDNGTLSEARINQAWEKVQQLKGKYNLKRKG